jgi:hypothetical protein
LACIVPHYLSAEYREIAFKNICELHDNAPPEYKFLHEKIIAIVFYPRLKVKATEGLDYINFSPTELSFLKAISLTQKYPLGGPYVFYLRPLRNYFCGLCLKR